MASIVCDGWSNFRSVSFNGNYDWRRRRGAVLDAEIQSLRSSSLINTTLKAEQWREGGLFATRNKTSTVLGTRNVYWGKITDPNSKLGLNLNFFGMEKNYLEGLGFTFSNGKAVYPMGQSSWHPPMAPFPIQQNKK